MREREPRRLLARGTARVLAALLLVVGLGVGHAEAQALRQGTPAAGQQQGALYDLEADERMGGHTLERHVGKSDEELVARLRREPDISGASTYTDALTARRIVALAIARARARIDDWESRRGSRPNLVLNYTTPDGSPIGRSLSRGQRVARPAERALVVLRWYERERRWIVLTSYPETRR
ncbi:MAG: RNase A-like domain-containing protein [Vicinamibacterales bacterium]